MNLWIKFEINFCAIEIEAIEHWLLVSRLLLQEAPEIDDKVIFGDRVISKIGIAVDKLKRPPKNRSLNEYPPIKLNPETFCEKLAFIFKVPETVPKAGEPIGIFETVVGLKLVPSPNATPVTSPLKADKDPKKP